MRLADCASRHEQTNGSVYLRLLPQWPSSGRRLRQREHPSQGRHRLCPFDQHPSESRKVGQPHGSVAAAKAARPSRWSLWTI